MSKNLCWVTNSFYCTFRWKRNLANQQGWIELLITTWAMCLTHLSCRWHRIWHVWLLSVEFFFLDFFFSFICERPLHEWLPNMQNAESREEALMFRWPIPFYFILFYLPDDEYQCCLVTDLGKRSSWKKQKQKTKNNGLSIANSLGQIYSKTALYTVSMRLSLYYFLIKNFKFLRSVFPGFVWLDEIHECWLGCQAVGTSQEIATILWRNL